VKKPIIIAAAVLVGGVAFMVALIAVVNARGGLDPAHPGLSRVPLLGALVKVRQPAPEQGPQQQAPAAQAGAAGAGDMSFLRFGSESRLTELAQELEAKKAEYDSLIRQTQRRTRELEAWEKQITVERDALRDKFEAEKKDLATQSQQLAQKDAVLSALQLKIDDDEAANLKVTAGIYDKMDPEQAAKILTQMCSSGKEDNAVKIISLMEDRSAAKTLESFTDAKLSAQITEQLRRIVKPKKTGG
jgi:flagellar motility protein MotE (MotC chaperone)